MIYYYYGYLEDAPSDPHSPSWLEMITNLKLRVLLAGVAYSILVVVDRDAGWTEAE